MDSPTDYTGNSKKNKEQPKTDAPEKKIVKVVTGEVNEKKTGISAKFKNIFLGADAKGLATYAVKDVLIPEIRNVMFDFGRAAWAQFIYGERGRNAQNRSHTDYSAASRSYSYRGSRGVIDTRLGDPRERGPLPSEGGRDQTRGLASTPPQNRLFTDKADADRILETFKDVLDQHEFVSHADFIMMLGETPQHSDHKFGWDYLGNVPVVHVRDGWVIDFPPMKEIR